VAVVVLPFAVTGDTLVGWVSAVMTASSATSIVVGPNATV
jgi:hypothetical protein